MIVTIVRRWYRRLTTVDAVKVIDTHNEGRADLDARLDRIAEATLNGDRFWFMDTPKDAPKQREG